MFVIIQRNNQNGNSIMCELNIRDVISGGNNYSQKDKNGPTNWGKKGN